MPLPDGPRQKYEATLGTSLSDVRVHTGKYAATLTNEHNARAFAKGNNIYFNEGENPADPKKEKLLAHEVAHTVQQRGSIATGPVGTTTPGDATEKEADRAASAMVAGEATSVTAQPAAIARKTTDEKEENTEPEEVTSVFDGWFSASKFNLTKAGAVQVEDDGDRVRLRSPKIVATSTATMNLPKNLKLGDKSVKVGPIQTLLSSKRTGVYKKDGNETRKTNKLGQIRDVAPRPGENYDMKKAFAKNEAPFYSGNPTVTIQKKEGSREADITHSDPTDAALGVFSGKEQTQSAEVVMIDQPSVSFAKELPDGSKLVGTEGADEFNTSAGFKASTGQTFGKAPFGWRLSWDRKINTEKPTEGNDKKTDEKTDAIQEFKQDQAIIEEADVFAVQLASMNSVDAAAEKGAAWLIRNMPKAREARPEAVEYMEQALAGMQVSICLVPTKSAAGTTSLTSPLAIDLSASITKMGGTRRVSPTLNARGSFITTIGALADVKTLTAGASVHIAAHEWDTGLWDTPMLGGTTSLALPMDGSTSGTISGGNFSYDVSVHFGPPPK